VTAGPLVLIVSLATFALAVGVARLIWRPLQRAGLTLAPEGRCLADDLVFLRLAPALTALVVVTVLVVPAFLLFEPRGRTEAAGVPILLLASVGAALVGASMCRAVRALWTTHALTREWLARATPLVRPGLLLPAFIVNTPESLVAVTGIVRRRLFVSDRVLAACGPQELDAILAHEAGHVGSADNLRRLLIRACPDAFWRAPEDHALERAWSSAAEEAADRFALRRGVDAVDLASALVAVARVGTPPRPASIASTFIEEDDVERRVRRALGGSARASVPGWLRLLRGAGLALHLIALGVAAAPGALSGIHEAVELAVGFLR